MTEEDEEKEWERKKDDVVVVVSVECDECAVRAAAPRPRATTDEGRRRRPECQKCRVNPKTNAVQCAFGYFISINLLESRCFPRVHNGTVVYRRVVGPLAEETDVCLRLYWLFYVFHPLFMVEH